MFVDFGLRLTFRDVVLVLVVLFRQLLFVVLAVLGVVFNEFGILLLILVVVVVLVLALSSVKTSLFKEFPLNPAFLFVLKEFFSGYLCFTRVVRLLLFSSSVLTRALPPMELIPELVLRPLLPIFTVGKSLSSRTFC